MKRYLTLAFLILLSISAHSQDPKRFSQQIKEIEEKYSGTAGSKDLILFTGSSSIRGWKNLPDYFPGKNIINTAFGGSQMSDLIYYCDTVIIKYKPVQIFVYEGDNDLGSGEKPGDILKETETLVSKIHKKLPRAQIVIISVKPSPSRWKLKEQFISLNTMFNELTEKYSYVSYVDLWTPLLNSSGRPRGELFVSDSLHINKSGYDIWAGIVKDVIR